MPSPLDRLSEYLDREVLEGATQTWLNGARALLAEVRTEQERLQSKAHLEGADQILEQLGFENGATRAERKVVELQAQVAALADDNRKLTKTVGQFSMRRSEDLAALITEQNKVAALAGDRERLREALAWAFEELDIDPSSDEPPSHGCEFVTNPLKGACDYHERWADAIIAFRATAPSQESGT